MRIAVLIIGLLLGLLMFLQVLLGNIAGSLSEDETIQQAAGVGLFVSIIWLAACAFVIAFPLASTIMFVLAALMAFAVSGDYPDMAVWGSLALILAALSLCGWFGKRRERREKRAELARQSDRDARMEDCCATDPSEMSPARRVDERTRQGRGSAETVERRCQQRHRKVRLDRQTVIAAESIIRQLYEGSLNFECTAG